MPRHQIVFARAILDASLSQAIAAQLHVDPRTLRRQLESEGTSFRELIDEVRAAIAHELLADVAGRLGYHDAAGFSRAYRRWTGSSPRRARKERRQARTRARILDATEEFFAAVDPESATIVLIADAADVAVATVYQHFAGKDDLHLAVVERALEKNERHMLAVYGADRPPWRS